MKHIFASTLLLFSSTSFATNPQLTGYGKQDFQQALDTAKVKTVLYRWYTFYERADRNWENQMEILADDVVLSSIRGTAKGKKQYRERVEKIPLEWKNAHHLKSLKVKRVSTTQIEAEAYIVYENIDEKGQFKSYKLKYDMILEDAKEGILPKFKKIAISPVQENPTKKFQDSYGENRAKLFLNYWIVLLEKKNKESHYFKEVLPNQFSINFPSGRLQSYQDVANWYQRTNKSIVETRHLTENFSSKSTQSGYAVSLNFKWNGINAKGQKMKAISQHNWMLIEDNGKYPKISAIDLKMIEPFEVIKLK